MYHAGCWGFGDEKNSPVSLKFAPRVRAANIGYLKPKLGLYSLLRIKCKHHLIVGVH